MNGGQPLSTLAASLLSELSRSAAEAERLQRSAYAQLAAEVAVAAEVHEDLTLDAMTEEAHLARFGLSKQRGHEDAFVLDDTACTRLRKEFAGIVAHIDDADVTIDDVLRSRLIQRHTLLDFIIVSLRRDARIHYLQTQTLLRDGLPHVTISRGSLTAKVVLGTDKDGSIVACLANEKNVDKSDYEAISTLTFEFVVGTFPSIHQVSSA